MKRFVCIISFLVTLLTVSAQSEVPSDSVRFSPDSYISFGDFLLDPGLLRTPKLPEITQEFILGPDVRKNYNIFFQLDPRWTFSTGSIPNGFSSMYPYGFYTGTTQFQTATFRLSDNTRLTLYGQYNADGWRMPNRSALPWERNNFMGGMELKVNKNFGIRIDVRTGHNPYFPN